MAQQSGNFPRHEPYNPLDKWNIGESIIKAMLERCEEALPPQRFIGAGVYALYYKGDHPTYAGLDKNCPIYVGKAVPLGSRKGGTIGGDNQGFVLYGRLKEHADSISSVSEFKLSDFTCRYISVDDIWIPLAETLLIERYHPVWNVIVEGFGNHDPGKGRHKQQRSRWDTLHEGRPWAAKLSPNDLSREQIAKNIVEFLRAQAGK